MIRCVNYFEKKEQKEYLFIIEIILYIIKCWKFENFLNKKREDVLKKIEKKFGAREEYSIIQNKKKLCEIMNNFFIYRNYRKRKKVDRFTQDDFKFLFYMALFYIKITFGKDFTNNDLQWVRKLASRVSTLWIYFYIFIAQDYRSFNKQVKKNFEKLYKYESSLSKFHQALFECFSQATLHIIEIFKNQSYLEAINDYVEEEED